MLEVKNLVKYYSTKGGVTVKALDDVSVKFPETGMVFLLGRSGSGKSTLLNVSGGLDKPDSGEIIVKGRSSKDFSSADFDSYRNTCIGFIFQEYNILGEFNVEQNIALALQLQGKPNDKKAVNELLEQVDLKGLGKRKPNTLSGGQKQRVAIARALIKNPEIIMADEPTGALDSNTGKQVLETLKKLSKTKLVIIVSHDREFAEFYGDRIIELKDGKILSDVTKELSHPKQATQNVQFISDDTISIKNAESISEEDVKNIVAVLKKNKGEAIITASSREIKDVKRACKIDDNGNKEVFNDTKNVITKEYDGKNTKFIKSRLPASHAIKMGASGLKTKPIRLIFTILLSIIAFTLFGVVATMTSYDASYSIGVGLEGSVYDNIAIKKNYVEKSISYEIKENGEKVFDYEWENEKKALFGESELKNLNAKGGAHNINYAGVFTFDSSKETWESPTYTISRSLSSTDSNNYHINQICGFSDCGEEYLKTNGFTIIGDYPTSSNEVMISKFLAESIKTYGFRKPDNSTLNINSIEDLIGQVLVVQNNYNSSVELVISGIVNTGELPNEFDVLKPSENGSNNQGNGFMSEQKDLEDKQESFEDYIKYSFHSVLYTSSDFYQAHKNTFRISNSSNYLNGLHGEARIIYYSELHDSEGNEIGDKNIYGSQFYTTELTLANNPNAVTFYTFNSDYSSITKENSAEFKVTGTNVYVNLEHYSIYQLINELHNLTYYNAELNIDSEILARFESAYYKMEHRYDENAEKLNDADYQAIAEYLGAILSLDLTAVQGGYYAKIQAMIRNVLTQSSIYDSLLQETKITIKGFYVVADGYDYSWESAFVSEEIANRFKYKEDYQYVTEYVTDYVAPTDGKYNYLITKSQNTLDQTEFILKTNDETYSYAMTNLVFEGAKMMTDMIEELSKVFLIIGAVIGGFAGLMLFNFISVSISAKRKEIGILRAVGARGSDVFKIFFAESSVIAFICFLMSSIAGFFVCRIINNSIGATIGLSLLNYGLGHVLVILALAFGVSFIATIIPVCFTAKKPPVESIRAL